MECYYTFLPQNPHFSYIYVAEKKGPSGHPRGSSLCGCRLDHHGPAIDAKHHLASIPHGRRAPRDPTPAIFWPSAAICPSMVAPPSQAAARSRSSSNSQTCFSAPLSKGKHGGQPLLRTISISGWTLQQPPTSKCHIVPGYSMWKGPAPPPVGPWRTPWQGSGTPPRQGSGATGRANGPGISDPKRGLRPDKQLPACALRGPDLAQGHSGFPGGVY